VLNLLKTFPLLIALKKIFSNPKGGCLDHLCRHSHQPINTENENFAKNLHIFMKNKNYRLFQIAETNALREK
jgi:hypothetical protein